MDKHLELFGKELMIYSINKFDYGYIFQMFCSFVIACLLSLIFSLHIILKKHKNLKSYSVPFIPYLYIGYLIVLLLAKELIFI